MKNSSLIGAAIFVAVAAAPGAANAYTISNALSTGCHESISSQALRAVRAELATAAPLPASEDDQALIDDLQFTPDGDMNDLGGATLLVGVRDNDLKGRSSSDLSQLAEVHGDPTLQQEHCLRAADQKEPGGTQAAVMACRAFILGRVNDALAGLDASGKPDPTKRTTLTLHLDLRGKVDASLPTYYVRIGQAIHAVQDSFTHTYRTADSTHITVTLDWLDYVTGSLVESRDGPAHEAELDRCDDVDAIRTTRHKLAVDASTAILRATLDPQMTTDGKVAAVNAVLDSYLTFSPGCTFDNGWCDAPERQYQNASACACSSGRIAGGALPLTSLVGLGLLAFARRRRLRSPRAAGAAIASVILLATGSARSQTEPPKPGEPTTTTSASPSATVTTTTIPASTPATPPTTATTVKTPVITTTTVTTPTVPDKSRPPPPNIVPVLEPGPVDQTAMAWGAFLGISGAVDNPALAGTAGLRLRATSHWVFGLDGEWNPWLATNGTLVRAGSANLYGKVIYQTPLAYEAFNLRSSLSLGGSYLLMDLYGAPKGSTGLYGDVSFLGLAWKVSRAFYLIIDPVNIAIPVPQLKGVPLTYPQYRFTLGLEVYLG